MSLISDGGLNHCLYKRYVTPYLFYNQHPVRLCSNNGKLNIFTGIAVQLIGKGCECHKLWRKDNYAKGL